MLVVFQVLQGGEDVVRAGFIVDHVRKDDHQGSLVDLFCQKVQHIRRIGKLLLLLTGLLVELVQLAIQHFVVHAAGPCLGVQFHLIGYDAESDGIALFPKQVHQRGAGFDGKVQLGLASPRLIAFSAKVHRRGVVDHDVAAQVGFLLEAFYKQFFSACIKFPVDMPRAFTGVIYPVLGKLHRKPMKGTLVHARDEAFHHLACQQFQASKAAWYFRVNFLYQKNIDFEGLRIIAEAFGFSNLE